MPEYLLKYSEDLLKNHPDPSAEWGGGADYTAGYGIEISNDEISVDEDVIASKQELNGYIKDDDTNYSAVFRGKGVYVKAEGAYTATSYADGSIGRSIPHQPGYTYTLPDKSGTFAMTVDIITSYNDLTDKPTIPTKTSDLTNDSGFITGVDWDDVADKPTFATVATSGDYDDLLNKPTIPDSTSDLINDSGYITGITSAMVTAALGYTPGTSNFSGSYNDLTDKPTIPTKTSDLTNDSGFITGVAWNDVTGKPTFATVATSGSYNDLTDKPTIPVVPTRAEAPFLGVTQPGDGVVLFSLDGSAGSYYKIVEPQAETHVNLQALDPNYGNGLTSSYNSSTKKLDVAIDTTTVALKSDIPTVPTTATSTSTSTVTATTQTLVFTMDDDTTVTVDVMTGATVATTTTTTLS